MFKLHRCGGRQRSRAFTSTVWQRGAHLLGAAGIIAGTLVCFADRLSAQPDQRSRDSLRLTISMARRQALVASLELRIARFDTAIARGGLRQAGAFRFNPVADALLGAGGTSAEIGVSQEVELFGQRGIRISSAESGLMRARGDVANHARLTIGEVDRTFFRLTSANRRAELTQEILELTQRLASIAERQLAAGEISRLEYNLALVELGRSRARTLAAKRQRDETAAGFALLLGLGRNVVVIPVLDSAQHLPAGPAATETGADTRILVENAARLNPDSLIALALRNRGDLKARDAEVQQAQAEVSLVRREALPNLVARGVTERGDNGRQVIRPGIGITLPVFNRNQGAADARRAAANQAEASRNAATERARTEVVVAVGAYRAAAAQIEALESTVLAPARQNRSLLEIAYREGKVGLPVLLLIRNQVFDAELEYWSAWVEEREALANLSEATGQNIIDSMEGGQ
ncbi:MAG: TolC family protein [Gemmatimonadaceae bacterium]